MSGNDCWNRVNFSCFQKVDSDLSDSLFHRCAVKTGKVRLPTFDSLNGITDYCTTAILCSEMQFTKKFVGGFLHSIMVRQYMCGSLCIR